MWDSLSSFSTFLLRLIRWFKIWAGMDTPSIYEKMEVDELLALYMSFEHVHRDDMGEYSRQEIYKLITCSIDIDNKMVMDLWKDYCREYRDVTELEFPYSPGEDLYDLESYYKMLDLYFQFSRKVGLPVQPRTWPRRDAAQRRKSAVF